MREEKAEADVLHNAEDESRNCVFASSFTEQMLVSVHLMPASVQGAA